MPSSWQTPDQTTYFDERLASYTCYSDAGTLKTFWTMELEEWFRRWPLSEPPVDFVAKHTTAEAARKAWRARRVDQIKRVFKTKSAENSAGRNLHLEDGVPRKQSEVHMYMILYYDSRIRDAVVEGWAVDRVERLEYRAEVNIPEDKIHPHDSYNFKDPKIPITYKNSVAQRLYAAESDVFKAHIRTQLEAWNDNGTTVHTNDEDERLTLVREYHKNNKALSRNVGVVLRNVERKCAAKGIVWLASPSPSKGGKPVAYFQCAGITPAGEDFETFIGEEKAQELKALFSSWIHKIYPSSDWPLYSFERPAHNGLHTGFNFERDGQEADDNTNAEQPNPDPTDDNRNAQQPDLAPTAPTSTTSSTADVAPRGLPTVHPVALPDSNDVESRIPPPTNSHPVTATHTTPANRDGIPPGLDFRMPPPPPSDGILTIEDLPANATEPAWMRAKGTLKYFREVDGVGRLSELSLHWYQLEKALGFQESTSKGLPSKNRPQVVRAFLKNGHHYTRDYGVNANTLGIEIMRWWEEISTAEGVVNVRFGGPTGIYTLVVLMSWWCKQLKGKPESELVDCLLTLEDIDRAFLSAIHDINSPSPAAPSLNGSPPGGPTVPPTPQPRGCKRSTPGELPSRKRLRSTVT